MLKNVHFSLKRAKRTIVFWRGGLPPHPRGPASLAQLVAWLLPWLGGTGLESHPIHPHPRGDRRPCLIAVLFSFLLTLVLQKWHKTQIIHQIHANPEFTFLNFWPSFKKFWIRPWRKVHLWKQKRLSWVQRNVFVFKSAPYLRGGSRIFWSRARHFEK